MGELLTFMSNHPVFTVIMTLLICGTIVDVANALTGGNRE
jgi:hypothetical protein